MVRIFVGANGKHKLLRTDAQTIEELFAAVERRLGVRIAKLKLDEADIEDDEDVLALNTDDKLQVDDGRKGTYARSNNRVGGGSFEESVRSHE